MKPSLFLSKLVTVGCLLTQPASAALSAVGDIAFTAYAPQEENFAFVALVDIGNGQSIFFDDEEWSGTAFGSSEGNARWTNDSGSTISAGTIITITDAGNNSGGTANIGSVTETNSGFNLASDGGDGVFAYLGTDRSPTTFLAGIGNASSASGLTSLTGTGLTLGLSAIDTGSAVNIEYTGSRSGQNSLSDYRSLLNDVSNWSSAPGVASGTFNTTSFAPVPEPTSALLSGVGSLLLLGRRRRVS